MSKSLTDDKYLEILNEAYEEAWEIANSEDGWKEEHKRYFLSFVMQLLMLRQRSSRLLAIAFVVVIVTVIASGFLKKYYASL